jgi:phage tail sheath gpL-like
MAINFQYYPDSNRVPGVYVEMDPSQANTGLTLQSTLIIGHRHGGAGQPNLPYHIQNQAQVDYLCGFDSMLSAMVRNYLAADNFADLWMMIVNDDPAGRAAVGRVTIGGTPSVPGVISLYIAGQLVEVPVTTHEDRNIIGARLQGAINQYAGPGGLPVMASRPVALNSVDLTANFKGLLGDQIDLRLNYLGHVGGEVTPPGLVITIVQPTGAATNPDITTGLANLTDKTYDFIVMPFVDKPNLDAMQAFLGDQSGRWSWEQMLYGGCFTATQASLGGLTNFGISRNDQHVSCMGYYDAPEPPWVWAAQVAGYCAASLRVDPGLPLQYMATTLKPPPPFARFTIAERNTLLYDGISTFRVDDAGQVIIERMCTTYQQNIAGQPDNSYLDVETMYGLMFVARDLTAYLATRYARKKLVSNDTPIQPGSNCVSPNLIGASTVSEYRALEAGGYVQNSNTFARNLIVEDAGNGLVKILAPVDLVNQLRVIAILLQFRKS